MHEQSKTAIILNSRIIQLTGIDKYWFSMDIKFEYLNT